MAWEDVKRINQYTIYTQFLKENPGTEYKKEIEQALETIKQQWPPEMRDVKSMAVEIEEDLPEGVNFFNSRDYIKSALKEIVEDMDFEFIEFDKTADAIIKVTVKGIPIGSTYQNSGSGIASYQYSGAIVSGDITMTKNNQSLLSKKFYGLEETPEAIAIGVEYKESDAPFNEAMWKSNFPAAGYALFTNLLNTKLQIVLYQKHEADFLSYKLRYETGRISPIVNNVNKNLQQNLITENTQGSISELNKKNIHIKSGNYLYANDKESGQFLWGFKTKDDILFDPYVTDNNVYVCAGQYLYAIDTEDGNLNWKLDKLEKNQHFTQNPIVLKNTVYIGYYRIYAVDAESGILKWKFRPDMMHSILNLQLSTNGTDTSVCVTSMFNKNYLHD